MWYWTTRLTFFGVNILFCPTRALRPHQLVLGRPSIKSTKRWGVSKVIDFDFTSRQGWDEFYASYEMKNDHSPFEWHSSISHHSILNEIEFRRRGQAYPKKNRESYLLVGCGNSALPRSILMRDPSANVTCQDNSVTCLDLLRKTNEKFLHSDRISYQCGDATALGDADTYTIVIDKGLMDALMCQDDWSSTIPNLLTQLPSILDNPWGMYVLVSYKLSDTTRSFLIKESPPLFEWTFDVESVSNDRVSVSFAQIQQL